MVIILNENRKKVIVIGHRGANRIAPENTLKSFQKAIELGADYIEFDIHASIDGVIVIMHGDDISTITGKKGSIKNMKLEELKKFDCGEGEKIPTLQELIQLAKGKINLQCEIKTPGLTEKLAKILKKEALIESSLISSFMLTELLKLQKIEPNLKLGLLLFPQVTSPRRLKSLIQKAIDNTFYSILLFYRSIDEELIIFCHDNNLKVIAWTVDSKNALKKLLNIGIDGIITNDIEKTKNEINQ